MTIRVGFLGAGFIARYHAHQFRQCATAHEITAVYDPVEHRRDRFAAAEGARACATPDEVLDAVDAVVVCTWTSEHLGAVRAAAARGLAIFCEKPLAVDLPTAIEMGRVVAEAGVVNMVGLVLRSEPALVAYRAMIADAGSGRIMNIVLRDDQFIPTQGHYRSDWRADPARVGRGALLEHSIHDLDILEWLAGPVVSVSATMGYFHDLAPIEDSVSAVLRFRDGHSAVLTSVWHDILARPSQRWIEVFCERALYTLEGEYTGPLRWQIDVPGAAGDRETDEGMVDGDATLEWLRRRGLEPVAAEEEFLIAVRDGSPSPAPTFADAVRAHVLADALYRSSADGGAPVDVTP